jgi:hypothetical protein
VASVIVTPTARADLERLIRTYSLPPTTVARVKLAIEPLATFPELGGRLEGRWAPFRFVLGPWRWMIIVYHFDPATDRLSIVTIQDGRSAAAPRAASPR